MSSFFAPELTFGFSYVGPGMELGDNEVVGSARFSCSQIVWNVVVGIKGAGAVAR